MNPTQNIAVRVTVTSRHGGYCYPTVISQEGFNDLAIVAELSRMCQEHNADAPVIQVERLVPDRDPNTT